MWLALLRYLLHCSGLEQNLQYLWGLPVVVTSLVSMAQLFSRVWLFATPWTAALPAPLSMGFFRQEYRSGLPFPPLGDRPNPGIEPESPASLALQMDSLLWAIGEAQLLYLAVLIHFQSFPKLDVAVIAIYRWGTWGLETRYSHTVRKKPCSHFQSDSETSRFVCLTALL